MNEKEIGELLATTKLLNERIQKLSDVLDRIVPKLSELSVEVDIHKKTLERHSNEIKYLVVVCIIILTAISGVQITEKLITKGF